MKCKKWIVEISKQRQVLLSASHFQQDDALPYIEEYLVEETTLQHTAGISFSTALKCSGTCGNVRKKNSFNFGRGLQCHVPESDYRVP